ncbi:hypothetical protein BDR07DRAFT_1354187 [Suillus spraguei]|nr:hypothetical protein BDR07DRAFT_1354187 [Suillus spraguei]
MMLDIGVNADTTPYMAPPGEEGLDLSYEGGEFKAFDGLSEQVASLSGCCYVDLCTHHDRIEVQTGHWNTQLRRLVDVYLDYRDRDQGDGMLNIPDSFIIPDVNHCMSLADIELVDLFGRRRTPLRLQPSHIYPNETLIFYGYLGCSPLYPTVTISLCTLAAYHQSHWTCPQFSIQAQCTP